MAKERLLVLLAALAWALYFAILLSLPALDDTLTPLRVAGSVISGVAVLLTVLLAGERPPWPAAGRIAMFAAGAAAIVLPYFFNWSQPWMRGFSTLGLVALSLPIGYWIGDRMEKVTNLVPLAIAMSLADIYSVLLGPSREVGEKLVQRIRWWEDYTARTGNEMNNNPSPGNKAGGLTTILEKSLGAIAKSGTTNLVDVVEYAETVKAHGLVFMDTPGYDPVSATGQVAGGANLICFTTGRGSAYGCAIAPTLKIATTTALFRRMPGDMDLDAGPVLEHGGPGEVGVEIYRRLLRVATSGRASTP